MDQLLQKKYDALKAENEELKKEVERLKNLLKRNGRVKDSEWMTNRRNTFYDLYYNAGETKDCIMEKMQISDRTYARLLQYAKRIQELTNKEGGSADGLQSKET